MQLRIRGKCSCDHLLQFIVNGYHDLILYQWDPHWSQRLAKGPLTELPFLCVQLTCVYVCVCLVVCLVFCILGGGFVCGGLAGKWGAGGSGFFLFFLLSSMLKHVFHACICIATYYGSCSSL